MLDGTHGHVYGPVPSRRLGRSLGIDPIPSKTCSYDCIYCQLGRTTTRTLERREYAPVGEILAELRAALDAAGDIDCITIAGSGEPTLHTGLAEIIAGARSMSDAPVTVITNGSLLWDPDVRRSLMAADIVVPSLDAGDSATYHYVNRPHGGIPFDTMVEGIAEFTREFAGDVWLEVFLLAGVTSIEAEVRKIASLVERIAPARTQITTATRPTAEDFAFAVDAGRIAELARIIPGVVEVVADGSETPSACVGDDVADRDAIIGILERHPCTVRDMAIALRVHPRAVSTELGALDREGRVRSVTRDGRIYYCVESPAVVTA
jgi:wyosine [tRNA(Phe)-imidazoG37] synthetase (radical SAM superfamily)